LSDEVGERVREISDDVMERVVAGDNWKTAPLPEWGGSDTSSFGRAIWENRGGFRNMFADVEDYLRKNWGATENIKNVGDPTMLSRLDRAEKMLGNMVGTSRRVSQRIAEVTANFVLHDYGRKRNFDLFLAYIYPYSFWYTRTYTNWLNRLTHSPGTVQAYVGYKQALAEINEDMPEWYKFNFNTGMIPGLDPKNPMFANFEATINPLTGILGVNFNDPDKRKTQFARFLDDLGKHGPSIYTPYALAYGMALYAQGEKEAGAKWMGRLLPQTRFFRALTSSLQGGRGVETDPVLVMTSLMEGRGLGGGMDPYEAPRVARALYAMEETGVLSKEQATDAAWDGWENDNYRLAMAHAQGNRNLGDFVSFFGVPNMRTRTAEDLEIDQLDQARRHLYKLRDTMGPRQWSEEWDKLRRQYPSMDILSMARKDGIDRDTAYIYSVLRRLPPGNKDPFYELVGVDPSVVQEIYDTKGKALETMDEPTRMKLMAGVVEMGTVLAFPSDVTKWEWEQAGDRYGRMEDTLLEYHGKDTIDKEAIWWDKLGEDKDDAYAWLNRNPDFRAYMNDKNNMENMDPLLRKYYSTYGEGRAMFNSMMWQDLNVRFPDGQEVQQAYYDARAAGKKVKPSDYLLEYWAAKAAGKEMTAARLISFSRWLPEAGDVSAAIRPDLAEELSTAEQRVRDLELDNSV
jgi:hypothetical protein